MNAFWPPPPASAATIAACLKFGRSGESHEVPANLDRALHVAKFSRQESLILQYVREVSWTWREGSTCQVIPCPVDVIRLEGLTGLRRADLKRAMKALLCDRVLLEADPGRYVINIDPDCWSPDRISPCGYRYVSRGPHGPATCSPEPPAHEPVSEELRLAVLERDAHRCLKCSKTHDLQVDHIIPRSMSGASVLDNLQTLCRPCNAGKGANAIDYRFSDHGEPLR